MKNMYFSNYYFDNMMGPYDVKMKLKNGSKFLFLNNYYKYNFIHANGEQSLMCYCSYANDRSEALKSISYSNEILSYISGVPICVDWLQTDNNLFEFSISDWNNISNKNKHNLNYISKKVSRFNAELNLFKAIMKLNYIALENMLNNNNEDSMLYYFKIIEKLAKKNYEKFQQRHYTKAKKNSNKANLKIFIKKFLKEELNITMTENMLNTSNDFIYKNLLKEAYNSIFLKISFFCNTKGIEANIDDLDRMVKLRNCLAHGDDEKDEVILNSLDTAFILSNEFIAAYFFDKRYKDICIDTAYSL